MRRGRQGSSSDSIRMLREGLPKKNEVSYNLCQFVSYNLCIQEQKQSHIVPNQHTLEIRRKLEVEECNNIEGLWESVHAEKVQLILMPHDA